MHIYSLHSCLIITCYITNTLYILNNYHACIQLYELYINRYFDKLYSMK